jgi:hypothetical protein
MLSPEGNAYVTVTNQRLLIHSTGKGFLEKSEINQQVFLSDIGMLKVGYTNDFNWLAFLICGLVFASLGGFFFNARIPFLDAFLNAQLSIPVPLGSQIRAIELGIMGVLLWFFCWEFCRRSMFYLQIFAGSSVTPLSLGEGYGKSSAFNALMGRPVGETSKMIRELGALVADIKLNGDAAISRWLEEENLLPDVQIGTNDRFKNILAIPYRGGRRPLI